MALMITLCNDSHDDNSHEPNGRTLRHAFGRMGGFLLAFLKNRPKRTHRRKDKPPAEPEHGTDTSRVRQPRRTPTLHDTHRALTARPFWYTYGFSSNCVQTSCLVFQGGKKELLPFQRNAILRSLNVDAWCISGATQEEMVTNLKMAGLDSKCPPNGATHEQHIPKLLFKARAVVKPRDSHPEI